MFHSVTPCPDLQDTPLTNSDLIFLLMGHTVEMKKEMFKLIILLPPNMNYSKEETLYKVNLPNKQSSMTLLEHASLSERQLLI